jgi:hypothetical protein
MSYRNATHKTTDIDDPDLLTRVGAVPDERAGDSEDSTLTASSDLSPSAMGKTNCF